MEKKRKNGFWPQMRRIGQWLMRPLQILWGFWGRLGLATRKLLGWLIWKPLMIVTMPLWLPISWLWEFVALQTPRGWRLLGRMGLALRVLLTRFVWRPFHLLVLRPAYWVYRRILKPISFVLWRILRGIAAFLGRIFRALYARFLQATAPQRLRLRRRFRSRWLVVRARWQVRRRHGLPENAVVAPSQPRSARASARLVRLATAVAAVALIIAVAALSLREPEPAQTVAADTNILPTATPQVIIITSTPLPSTPQPTPDVSIKLTPWPTPDPLQGGGVVLFTQHIGGNSDIYILPVGEGEALRLTTHPAADRSPVWSPDGTKIAFSSRRDGNWELYLFDIVRDDLRRVTNDPAFDGAPSWSPDSQWLVYESYQDENLDIYLIKADGQQRPLRLTDDPAPDFDPVWSPDGRHIAFTSWRTGNREIFIRSLDDPTGDLMTNASANPNSQEGDPAFSLDGRSLLYVSQRGEFPVLMTQPLTGDYFLDGSPRELGQQGYHPYWSPDGRSLVYVHSKDEGRGQQQFLVAASPNAFGVAPQLFAAAGQIADPSWANVTVTTAMVNLLRHVDGPPKDTPLFVEAIAPPARGDDPPSLLFELQVNAPSPYLSDQVDQSFTALRERVMLEAGWDFLGQLDGMFAPLDENPLPDPAANAWNKAGRAFDFYYREALGFEPRVEVVREDIGTETYWHIYVRTALQDGSQGEPLRHLSWEFQARSGDDAQYYEQGGKWREDIPSGYYIDFTAIAADYGWQRVPANTLWRTFFPDIRYWHYEKREGLTLETAFSQLYSPQQLRGFNIP